MGRLPCRRNRFLPLPRPPPKICGPLRVSRPQRILAGRLGHLHVLRLLSHLQLRRKLDRRLRRRFHRLRLLRQRSRHRLRMVGHRLSRGMGLGRNLLLRRSRQRLPGPGPLPLRQLRRQSALERRQRRTRRQPARPRRSFAPAPFLARPLRAQQIRIPTSPPRSRQPDRFSNLPIQRLNIVVS